MTDQTGAGPGPDRTGPVDLAFAPHLTEIDPAVLVRLRASLAERATGEGVLDVAYRVVDSPVGPLLIAATNRGLVRVAYEREGHDLILQQLSDRLSPRVLEAPSRLGAVARQIEEYFAGRRRRFDVPLDLSLSAGFRRTVLQHLGEIPFGVTESYTEVARAVGNPKAVRAVGTACATNPLPVVVPCHRVLRSDGSLGGYIGGLEAKSLLLHLEAAAA
ncbi:methylated-DNA--[protein]-cysteine S-methyltransferase [Sinomonas atrocyanea]|uniref:methylated-DNA--[protein]-cysteine S-methyltransferase n=1 Tax=Sinomonas atrocyanea TaxID=37927 RepID=UPI003D98132E